MRDMIGISGTGVLLEFPYNVKFHKDSCLRRKSVIQSYDNNMYIMPVVHVNPVQA